MSIDEIYFKAIEYNDEKALEAYLDTACGIGTDLRRRVEKLLRARGERRDFLEPLIPPSPAAEEGIGRSIGPYRLLDVIGEGGMGIVYLAEQLEPVRRKVALKVIKPGMETKQVIARFEAERQALAMMDHPNIARVFEAGATDSGLPYFVMERVEGIPITTYCDQNQLSINDRIGLFIKVCQAVQHAHRNAVIHRDLKPSNVLIATSDGVPVPKVIDFGIAKATAGSLTEKTLFTGDIQLVGTPLYMSPEQAEMSGIVIDGRSDVYSLGVLLYELLSGATPFDQDLLRKAAFDEVRRIVREEDPPRPSDRLSSLGETLTDVTANRQTDPRKLNRSLKGELDWITMKALEKDRRRRYSSPEEFADDLKRHLENRPVAAGPPSLAYRARKFARRNRLALSAAAVIGVIAVSWGIYANQLRVSRLAITEARKEIERRESLARHRDYVSDIHQADQFVQAGQGRRALEILEKWRPAPGTPDDRNFAWYYLMRLCHNERLTLRGHVGDVYHAEFSPDGRMIVSSGKDGTARLWNATTGEAIRVIETQGGEANWATFSPDGKSIVTAHDDGRIRIWDVSRGASLGVIDSKHKTAVFCGFTPEGHLITAGRIDGFIKLWDAKSFDLLASVRANEKNIEGLAVSPDGRVLADVGGDARVRLWNTLNLSPAAPDLHFGIPMYGVDFSEDGETLVIGDVNGGVACLDRSSGKPLSSFSTARHTADVQSVAFARRGRVIASSGGYGILTLWDAETGKQIRSLLGHADKIWGVSVSLDGETILSASSDGTAKLWDAQPKELYQTLDQVEPGFNRVTFPPDGQTLMAVSLGKAKVYQPPSSAYYYVDAHPEIRAFNIKTGQQVDYQSIDTGTELSGCGISADGSVTLFVLPDASVKTWDVVTCKQLTTIKSVEQIRASRSGFLVERVINDRRDLLDSSTEAVLHQFTKAEEELVAWDKDRGVIVFYERGRLGLANTSDGSHRMSETDCFRPVASCFSPDSRLLAIGDSQAVIQLWDMAMFKPIAILLGHNNLAIELGFSPDGKVLLSAGNDHQIQIWDLVSKEKLIALSELPADSRHFCFSPDGRTLAFVSDGRPRWIETSLLDRREEVSVP